MLRKAEQKDRYRQMPAPQLTTWIYLPDALTSRGPQTVHRRWTPRSEGTQSENVSWCQPYVPGAKSRVGVIYGQVKRVDRGRKAFGSFPRQRPHEGQR
jgi:hypothetical protein